MGVSEELLIRVTAEMEGVDLQICSVKTNLAKACFKGLLLPNLFSDEKVGSKGLSVPKSVFFFASAFLSYVVF